MARARKLLRHFPAFITFRFQVRLSPSDRASSVNRRANKHWEQDTGVAALCIPGSLTNVKVQFPLQYSDVDLSQKGVYCQGFGLDHVIGLCPRALRLY